MSFFYRSARIGKNGKQIEVLKIRTLKEGSSKSNFAEKDAYIWYGRFLRKIKADELPQIWTILKGDMALFGPRPMEARELDLLPEGMKNVLLSVKPGLIDLASIHFFNEESILQQMKDPHRAYFEVIRPIKFALQAFYIEHRNWALDFALAYMALKKVLLSFFKKPCPTTQQLLRKVD